MFGAPGAFFALLDSLSGTEILVVLVAALIVLGPDKLPGVARQIGQWSAKIRNLTQNLQTEMRDVLEDPMMKPIKDLGEFGANPRRKLTQLAMAAEAEAQAEAAAAREAAAIAAADQSADEAVDPDGDRPSDAEVAEEAASAPDPAPGPAPTSAPAPAPISHTPLLAGPVATAEPHPGSLGEVEVAPVEVAPVEVAPVEVAAVEGAADEGADGEIEPLPVAPELGDASANGAIPLSDAS